MGLLCNLLGVAFPAFLHRQLCISGHIDALLWLQVGVLRNTSQIWMSAHTNQIYVTRVTFLLPKTWTGPYNCASDLGAASEQDLLCCLVSKADLAKLDSITPCSAVGL